MPIKGRINAMMYDHRVEKMTVGQLAYISAYDIFLTKKALFIELSAQIIPEEEYSEDLFFDYVPIKRIGPYSTEDDFQIDFSDLSEFEFILETNASYMDAMREGSLYVVFANPPYIINETIVIEKVEETVESLTIRHDQAIVEEKYELARTLLQKITEMKKKN